MKEYKLYHETEYDEDVDFKLIEIPNELRDEFETLTQEDLTLQITNTSLHLCGTPNSNAHLFSNQLNFQLKKAPTSNSLLIATQDDKDNKITLIKSLEGVYYCEKVAPKLDELYNKLNKTSFDGMANEFNLNKDELISYKNLSQWVQASELDINLFLKEIYATEHEGYLRILKPSYQYEILSSIILTFYTIEDLNKDHFDKNSLLKLMEDFSFPKWAVNHILICFSEVKEDGFYYLIQDKIIAYYGWSLLVKYGAMEPGLLIETIAKELFEDYVITIEKLKPYYYVLPNQPNLIAPILPAELPFDLKSRFDKLFELKMKWIFEELKLLIEPLLRSFTKKEQDILYLKYCKLINLDGQTYVIRKLK